MKESTKQPWKDPINQRINELIEAVSNNPNTFSKLLGVDSAVIYNIIGGRQNKPSYDLLQKIISKVDNINTKWLMEGKGDMFNDTSSSVSPASGDTEETFLSRISKFIDKQKEKFENELEPDKEEIKRVEKELYQIGGQAQHNLQELQNLKRRLGLF